MGELALQLQIEGESPLPTPIVERAVVAVLEEAGIAAGTLDMGVFWVDENAIATLNRDHRHVDGPTDVLSFPIDGLDELPAEFPRQLGDLFVCVTYVEKQLQTGTNIAASEDDRLDRALVRCIVHGMLHLIGDDHESEADADAMRMREDRLVDLVDGVTP